MYLYPINCLFLKDSKIRDFFRNIIKVCNLNTETKCQGVEMGKRIFLKSLNFIFLPMTEILASKKISGVLKYQYRRNMCSFLISYTYTILH